MGNRVFEIVLNRKIENFVATFIEDSTSIFFDDKKLIHPGEYGRYRENSTKDLLKIITKHKISDGFLITPNDKISSQLDLVIYKNDEAPLLENNYIDFFSVESVLSIGEIKSKLDITRFTSALRKMAENKRLYQYKKGICIQKKFKGAENDNLISFLVCATTSFDPQSINFEEIYEGIEYKYWHNFILIIDKGLIGYQFEFSKLNSSDAELFISEAGNLSAVAYYEYSEFTFNRNIYITKPIFHQIDNQNKYYHIKLFLTQISQALSYKSLYETGFVDYLDLKISPIFNANQLS